MADNRVVLINKAGERFTLPENLVQDALADPVEGARVETPEEAAKREQEAKFGDRPVSAAVAGFARGTTGGLSDVLLEGAGIARAKTLQGVKEENEAASMTGEAASYLLPTSAARGAAAVGAGAAKATAKGLGEGLASKIVSKGVGSAVEGSLYGLGTTVSEAALGDEELTGQKLLAGGGMGAILGFGFGAVPEVVKGAAGKAIGKAIPAEMGAAKIANEAVEATANAPRLGPDLSVPAAADPARATTATQALKDVLGKAWTDTAENISARVTDPRKTVEDYAAKRAVNAAGVIQKDLKRAGWDEQDLVDVGHMLLDDGIVRTGDTINEILPRAQAALQKEGSEIGAILKATDAQLQGGKFDMGRFVERAKAEVLDPLVGDPALKAEAKHIEELLKDYYAAADNGVGFAEANKFKSSLQDKINFNDDKAKSKALQKLQGVFNQEIEGQLAEVGGQEALAAFKKAKNKFGILKEITGAGEGGVQRLEGNRQISLTDSLGAVAGAGIGGLPGLVIGGAANKVIRDYGSAFVADNLRKFARSPAFGQVADSFASWWKDFSPKAAAVLGPFEKQLQEAASKGPESLVLTHAALSETQPAYREAMTSAGLNYAEDGAAAEGRVGALGTVRRYLQEQDFRVEKAVDSFLKGQTIGAAVKEQRAREKKVSPEQLAELANNPQAMADRMAQAVAGIATHAPGAAMSASTTAARAVSYLHEKVPKNPATGAEVLPAFARPWKPSAAEVASFDRTYEAVANPEHVLEHLQRGTITQEAVEALEAVYPKLYEGIRAKAMERASLHPSALSYRQKISLGLLLKVPLDPTMRPAMVSALQANVTQPESQPQQPQGGKSNLPTGATDTERMLTRRG